MWRSAIRSGDEPAHARSPLRLRLILAGLGVVSGTAGTIVFWLASAPPLAAGFAAAGVIAAINTVVVLRHLRQGPHYQPGPDIPPYRPVDPAPVPRPVHQPVAVQARLRRYLVLMGCCLTLLVLAWGWVRLFSTGLAVAMSLVAMVIPPTAAIVANTGALSFRPDTGEPEDQTPLGRRKPPPPERPPPDDA